MGKRFGLIWSLAVLLTAGSASAQEFGEYEPDNYPKKLSKRPLLLAPSMFEVSFGGASNMFAAAPFDAEDRFRSKIDFRYTVGTRFQFGAESDMYAFPTDDFAVGNLGGFVEYNLVPTISGRVGAFMRAPRDANDDLDAQFGLRASLPMKFRLGNSAALVAQGGLALLDGDSVLELPVGLQLNLMDSLAAVVDTSVRSTNFEFSDGGVVDGDKWDLGFGFGAVVSMTRKIDVTLRFSFTDLANDNEDRWIFAFFSFRG